MNKKDLSNVSTDELFEELIKRFEITEDNSLLSSVYKYYKELDTAVKIYKLNTNIKNKIRKEK